MADLNTIGKNLDRIKAQITLAAAKDQRAPQNITLLAVSKTKPVSDIISAYQSGQRDFGENYVQEGVEKIQALQDYSDILWHFIGPLQSNKSKIVAENFDWIHSIDRFKIAKRLNDQRPASLPPLNVCIQVNIDSDDNKSGVIPDQTGELLEQMQSLKQLKLRGLMTIPKANQQQNELEASFAKMHSLYESLKRKFTTFDTLSMGMSGDLALAIKQGSTMVRIGTAIFGQRTKKQSIDDV
ncbi:MAG: YggS family pyridoxal phosphate-dependent enzyme [Pseudomonadota bacterium]